MGSESSSHPFSPESLRDLARLRGVSPTDADLEAVLGFLTPLLPMLEELERQIPPETPPAGLFLP